MLYLSSRLLFTETLLQSVGYPHFTNEEDEAHGGVLVKFTQAGC